MATGSDELMKNPRAISHLLDSVLKDASLSRAAWAWRSLARVLELSPNHEEARQTARNMLSRIRPFDLSR